MFILVSGFAVVLLDHSLPLPDVLTLLATVVVLSIALTSSITANATARAAAALAPACAAAVRYFFARATVTW